MCRGARAGAQAPPFTTTDGDPVFPVHGEEWWLTDFERREKDAAEEEESSGPETEGGGVLEAAEDEEASDEEQQQPPPPPAKKQASAAKRSATSSGAGEGARGVKVAPAVRYGRCPMSTPALKAELVASAAGRQLVRLGKDL